MDSEATTGTGGPRTSSRSDELERSAWLSLRVSVCRSRGRRLFRTLPLPRDPRSWGRCGVPDVERSAHEMGEGRSRQVTLTLQSLRWRTDHTRLGYTTRCLNRVLVSPSHLVSLDMHVYLYARIPISDSLLQNVHTIAVPEKAGAALRRNEVSPTHYRDYVRRRGGDGLAATRRRYGRYTPPLVLRLDGQQGEGMA